MSAPPSHPATGTGRPLPGQGAVALDSGAELLLFRAGSILGGFAASAVAETLRPLPIERLPGMAACVLGASVIRGKVAPVIDARILFSTDSSAPPARLVMLRVGQRRVAFAVDEVQGLRQLEGMRLLGLSPLLGAAAAGLVAEIGTLDSDLLLVLDAGRLVPEAVWRELDAGSEAQG